MKKNLFIMLMVLGLICQPLAAVCTWNHVQQRIPRVFEN